MANFIHMLYLRDTLSSGGPSGPAPVVAIDETPFKLQAGVQVTTDVLLHKILCVAHSVAQIADKSAQIAPFWCSTMYRKLLICIRWGTT